jgi:cellulose synthase/poly-beta-1,6-N-acetylglucosamine synthase-like glycosyltransferase
MYSYVRQALANNHPTFRPKVSVILPCKGLDPGFKDNVGKLLRQDYLRSDGQPNFEVIFAVATNDDPALNVLQAVMQECPSVKTKLVVAGVCDYRAQKINNQLAALKERAADSEVLVFVDSDVVARPDFLGHLVAPLSDSTVGIATGYRFYIPFRGDWPSLLRSMWNRLTAWELVSRSLSFAWGGAMAITAQNFEKAEIRRAWDRAADDDLSMTTAVKLIGLKVIFVPQCLVVSDGDASLTEIVDWTNRQLILTKVYYPALWWKAMLRATVLALWLLIELYCLASFLFGGHLEYLNAALIGLLLWPVELYFLFQAQGLWKNVLSDSVASLSEQEKIDEAYDKTLWRFTIMLPLAHLLLPWLTLYSMLTNKISWRGVKYELKSPSEIVVV